MCNGSGGLTAGFAKFKATFAMNSPKNTAYYYFYRLSQVNWLNNRFSQRFF